MGDSNTANKLHHLLVGEHVPHQAIAFALEQPALLRGDDSGSVLIDRASEDVIQVEPIHPPKDLPFSSKLHPKPPQKAGGFHQDSLCKVVQISYEVSVSLLKSTCVLQWHTKSSWILTLKRELGR